MKFIENYNFTFAQKKILQDIATDFLMWNERNLDEIFPKHLEQKFKHKELANQIVKFFENEHLVLKSKPKNYENFSDVKYQNERKITFEPYHKESLSIGACPVASPNTRCCNLMTLDAVESCGFDCSYCSIQSFYNENKIRYDKDFAKKLAALELDSSQTYHIGTGQSSDSLMWGDKFGTLSALVEFAKKNPNVILELKTKSDNIKFLLENEIPRNIICTWSLNTSTIIKNEEHLTASLESRIASARALADKNILVGFHFHPIVVYENYLEEYGEIYTKLLQTFKPSEVVLVSLGTLTFIKPVIQKLRKRGMKTKILQMQFVDANKKSSYSLEQKREMFKHAYQSLNPWHGKVYFYLCMEDELLWRDVFGFEYISNNQFEEFMKLKYMEKINDRGN